MTSEVKGHFYKVEDNLVNHMQKKIRNDIWTGLCVRRFQSYEFNHVMACLSSKNFPSKVNLEKKIRPFNDLWGQMSFSQSCGQTSEIHAHKILCWYLDWLLSYTLFKKVYGRILYLRQHNLHVVENFKGQTFNNVVVCLMTSEAKGHFCKVEDNPLKLMYFFV